MIATLFYRLQKGDGAQFDCFFVSLFLFHTKERVKSSCSFTFNHVHLKPCPTVACDNTFMQTQYKNAKLTQFY